MLTEETIRRLAKQDARLRETFRSPILPATADSLLAHAKAVLDGVQEAAQAEKFISEGMREQLAKLKAAK